MSDLRDPRIQNPSDAGGEPEVEEAAREEGAEASHDSQPRRLDPLMLQSQARSLRKRSSGSIRSVESFEAPMWKKAVTLLVLILVLGSVMYLLTFPQSRRQVATQLAGGVEGVRGMSEDRILRLPPPVREEVARSSSEMPTVIFRSGSSQSESAGDIEGTIRFLDTAAADNPQAQGAAEAAPPSKTEGAQGAYQVLLEQSEAARQVAEGEAEGWTFQEWKPVQNNPPGYFISLLAADAEGNVQQLIWEVNTEQGSAVARSQLARELVRQLEN